MGRSKSSVGADGLLATSARIVPSSFTTGRNTEPREKSVLGMVHIVVFCRGQQQLGAEMRQLTSMGVLKCGLRQFG